MHRLQGTDPAGWWDTIKTGAEIAGPWGALGGLSVVVWRIVSAAFESATSMRQRAYLDILKAIEAERAEHAADRDRWAEERASLIAEMHQLRQDDG